MCGLGIALLVLGALGLMFALSMDTSVSAGFFGRVNNIGLMNDKQNYIIAAVVLIAGLLMAVLGVKSGEAPLTLVPSVRARVYRPQSAWVSTEWSRPLVAAR